MKNLLRRSSIIRSLLILLGTVLLVRVLAFLSTRIDDLLLTMANGFDVSGEPAAVSSNGVFTPELIVALLSAALLVVTLILRFTKRDSGAVVTLEYKAPDGLSPAEVGYLIDGHVSSTDMTSLIYYWASHGHLSVEMNADGSFTLRHRSDLDAAHPEYEKDLFNSLWHLSVNVRRPSYATAGSDDDGYRTLLRSKVTDSAAMSKRFSRPAEKAAKALRRHFLTEGELTNRARDIYATIIPTIIGVMAALLPFFQTADMIGWIPLLGALVCSFILSTFLWMRHIPVFILFSPEISVFARLGIIALYLAPAFAIFTVLPGFDAEKFSTTPIILSLGYFIAIGIFDNAYVAAKTNIKRARRLRLGGWALCIVTSALLVLIFMLGSMELWSILLFVVCAALCIAIAPGIRRPSEHGASLTARCEGFRNFIATAEKSRIEMLLEDDPEYYYYVLPYAHVLGVSDIWADKTDLAGIKVPDWCSSEYTSHNAITSTMMKWMELSSGTANTTGKFNMQLDDSLKVYADGYRAAAGKK